MRERASLSAKILILAFLNFFLLLAALAIFAKAEFRINLGSVVFAPVQDRILSVSRLIALDLPEHRPDAWTGVLARYASIYPAQFFLFNNSGERMAGESTSLPPSLANWIKEDHGPFDDAASGHAKAQTARSKEGPHGPFYLIRTRNPTMYWAGARIPVRNSSLRHPLHGTLVWMFPSLWTNPFFFDFKPYAGLILAVVLLSVACWLPFIRGLTRSIRQLTRATGEIAEGRFDIEIPSRRRDELGKLSESIHRMAGRLAGFVHGQKRFLGDIAHELCSPIARIQLAIGILEQRAAPKQQEYISDLQEEVQHMAGLVNELLAFSKSQMNASGKDLERVNVSEMVKRVLQREMPEGAPMGLRSTNADEDSLSPAPNRDREGADFLPAILNRTSIEINIDKRLEVKAYPDYLFRSLSNLVRNALRYAADAGPITISATDDGNSVWIRIADQGPGLPEGELDEVFKPFYRPEFVRQRETGGAGLGLAIVRSCIEACGGAVQCRNRSPKGLEVEIRLVAAEG
jgi:two-component system sensor histidine kinase CpxA